MSNKKLRHTELSRHEWLESLKTPSPHRNKKKYTRKTKHKRNISEE